MTDDGTKHLYYALSTTPGHKYNHVISSFFRVNMQERGLNIREHDNEFPHTLTPRSSQIQHKRAHLSFSLSAVEAAKVVDWLEDIGVSDSGSEGSFVGAELVVAVFSVGHLNDITDDVEDHGKGNWEHSIPVTVFQVVAEGFTVDEGKSPDEREEECREDVRAEPTNGLAGHRVTGHEHDSATGKTDDVWDGIGPGGGERIGGANPADERSKEDGHSEVLGDEDEASINEVTGIFLVNKQDVGGVQSDDFNKDEDPEMVQ